MDNNKARELAAAALAIIKRDHWASAKEQGGGFYDWDIEQGLITFFTEQPLETYAQEAAKWGEPKAAPEPDNTWNKWNALARAEKMGV